MERTRIGRAVAAGSLGAVLLTTLVTLGLGFALKAPCAAGSWSDGRQYKLLCYSDIVPLYGTEGLQEGRIPYLQACPAGAGICDEYPVLTMYFMRGAAAVSNGYGSFFGWNVAGLTALALVTAWALWRMAGSRALYFAAAPTLLIYGFMNWDLLAVALATVGTLAYLRGRDRTSGVLLGLGAAAKLYPALLLVPFAIGRLRASNRGGAGRLVGWAALAFVVVNLPFALLGTHQWLTFFRFNSTRPADWDSLWFIACQRMHGGTSGCVWPSSTLNSWTLVAFVLSAAACWAIRRRIRPDFPAWTFGFPLIVCFLLANKVYSPQYSLWLLPWFALALPNPWLFAAFEAADVAVFVTRFTWFGRYAGQLGDPTFAHYGGATLTMFEAAVLVRAAVLVVCLAAWVLRDREAGLVPATLAGQPELQS